MNITTPFRKSHDMAGIRLLMTVDAVGGVWRYAMDLGTGLRAAGLELVFAGFGPEPSAAQRAEAEALGVVEWCHAPLDWMLDDEAGLDVVPDVIARLVALHGVDLVHLNLPSQAVGLKVPVPVVVVSHSCVVSWFAAVRQAGVPRSWEWQARRNMQGFAAADISVAPSRSHAALLESCYGPIRGIHVVHNASRLTERQTSGEPFVLAAGRWWDDGKNAAVLDEAAPRMDWPLVMAGANRSPKGDGVKIQHADHRGERGFAEVVGLMSRAGIFVSPSLYEPFGLAVLEAARSGLPLVLSDIPTYRELWDGAALFFAPNRPEALAAEVNRLVADRALRQRLGAAAQERAARYRPAQQTEAMLRIYGDLCAVTTPSAER
ncbi:glycosyltransferase family 4 protein [Plastorhodobacter daqingensis]|uniref:Glycosyltransferase family 4 protein n=1 Tax=Plastorhodobacter daqingensis TaxID=1387281 RepID=A0ABW2UJD9_9RHOB